MGFNSGFQGLMK